MLNNIFYIAVPTFTDMLLSSLPVTIDFGRIILWVEGFRQ